MKQRYFLFLLSFLSTAFLAASPIAICESYVNIAVPGSGCTVDVHPQDIDGGSYDPSGSDAVAKWVTGGLNLAPGVHLVTLNVWSNGVTNSCWSTVTVEDKLDPVATCTNQTIYLVAPDQPFILNVDDMVSFTDNCSVTGQINVADIARTTYGTEYFSAEATDPSGNYDYCWGTITTVDGEPQNYCASDRNDHYEHIANLNLTTSSGTLNHSSGSDGGYNWHYPESDNILYHGFSYNLSYSPGFRFSTTYHEYWRVYIDKNADGDFTDSGELLHQWRGYGGNSFTFTSPGTVWGWSRIRVVMSYGGYAGPCGTSGYGETEDISVYLRPYFFFPWPGFRQAGEEITTHAANEHSLELPLAENRPVEAPHAAEAAQRSGLEINTPALPETNNITLYPNPVRAGLPLTITGHDAATPLQLFNLSGKVVKEYSGKATQLNIPAHLPAGIYLLRSQDWTRRVIVR